jgi:predicted double-glycine peptidase
LTLLLAEQEITTLIDIERRKSIHTGLTEIAKDHDIASLSQPTSVEHLTRTLQEELPLE